MAIAFDYDDLQSDVRAELAELKDALVAFEDVGDNIDQRYQTTRVVIHGLAAIAKTLVSINENLERIAGR